MSDGSTPEIAGFLRSYPPFDELDAAAVARVASAAELESFDAGAVIFSQGDDPVRYLRVVRSGEVEITADGRVERLLGEKCADMLKEDARHGAEAAAPAAVG